MQQWAETFYKSKRWQQCRQAYYKKAQGLCECCLSKGILSPGVIVHHKIHLTEKNITDPNISLNFNNLELLCRDCHATKHANKSKRYKADKNGNVTLF